MSPSITRTSAKAVKRSLTSPSLTPVLWDAHSCSRRSPLAPASVACRRRSRNGILLISRGGCGLFQRTLGGLGWRITAHAVEVAEELVVRRQDEQAVVALDRLAIGLHRAIELGEVSIGAEGRAQDTRPLGFALTAQDLSLTCCLGADHGRLPIGAGADTLSLFGTLGSELRRFTLTFRLHAIV